jgi:sec-independent protein translocase protein TatA
MVGDILQPTHLLFVLVVALLVLGPKRLPEVGRSLGSGLRDFRSAMSGEPLPAPRDERPSPEYVHAPPQEPLAPIVEPTPVQATAVEHEPQTRSSEPIA